MTNIEKMRAIGWQISCASSHKDGALEQAMQDYEYDGGEIKAAATEIYPGFTLREINDDLGRDAVLNVMFVAVRKAAADAADAGAPAIVAPVIVAFPPRALIGWAEQ